MNGNWSKSILAVDYCSDAGLRNRMEDAICVLPDLLQYVPENINASEEVRSHSNNKMSYFAVFDGHGGDSGAKFLQQKFHHFLARHPAMEQDICQALTETFAFADHEFLRSPARQNDVVGSTAVVALLDNQRLHVAWLGDSDAVIFYNRRRSGNREYKHLTTAHRPERPDERRRIEDRRGYVSRISRGSGRVNGLLAVSRSIGDERLKEWVISVPEISSIRMDDKSLSFLVLASDGLWDSLSPESVHLEVIKYIRYKNKHLFPEPGLLAKGVATHLIKKAIRENNSMDNISAIVIFFRSSDCFAAALEEDNCLDFHEWPTPGTIANLDCPSNIVIRKKIDLSDSSHNVKRISTRKRISHVAKLASRSLRKVLIRGLLQA